MGIKIAIVDDVSTNRVMLSRILERSGKFEVIFSSNDGEDFLAKMKMHESELPQLVLMDLEMPRLDGISTIAVGSVLYEHVKFIVLTVFDEDEKIFMAIQAGACGYLLKEESYDTIEETLVSTIESGSVPMSPSIARKTLQILSHAQWQAPLKQDTMPFDLSEREVEILKLMVNGLDYKDIAAQLFISPLTVRKHTANIYGKLHVNSKAQVMRLAYRQGLI